MNCDWTLSPLVNSLIFTLTLFPPTQANSDITHTHTFVSASTQFFHPNRLPECRDISIMNCNLPRRHRKVPFTYALSLQSHPFIHKQLPVEHYWKTNETNEKKTYTVKTAWPLLLLQQTYGEGHRLYLCICFVTGTSRNPGSAQRLCDSMGLFFFQVKMNFSVIKCTDLITRCKNGDDNWW